MIAASLFASLYLYSHHPLFAVLACLFLMDATND